MTDAAAAVTTAPPTTPQTTQYTFTHPLMNQGSPLVADVQWNIGRTRGTDPQARFCSVRYNCDASAREPHIVGEARLLAHMERMKTQFFTRHLGWSVEVACAADLEAGLLPHDVGERSLPPTIDALYAAFPLFVGRNLSCHAIPAGMCFSADTEADALELQALLHQRYPPPAYSVQTEPPRPCTQTRSVWPNPVDS